MMDVAIFDGEANRERVCVDDFRRCKVDLRELLVVICDAILFGGEQHFFYGGFKVAFSLVRERE